MQNKNKVILIATGASGGHIFPALAVADELKKQGYECIFAGDEKGFMNNVTTAGYKVYTLPSSPWNVANPLRKLFAIFNIVRAMFSAMRLIHKLRPSAVFGTGGYATVACMVAGKISGVPTIIHEQNVLPGRANSLLAKWVDVICTTFEKSHEYFTKSTPKLCGNPIRSELIKARTLNRDNNGKFNILVLGGSQGARVLSDVIPQAVSLLNNKNIKIIQQVRPEDEDRVKAYYTENNIEAEVATFFNDIPQKLIETNLVIGRSGTSTVIETATLGRAALYIPLTMADGHQLLNAQVAESAGAASIMPQNEFTPENLATYLKSVIATPEIISNMEAKTVKLVCLDAAKKVAGEVIKLAESDVMHLASEVEKV